MIVHRAVALIPLAMLAYTADRYGETDDRAAVVRRIVTLAIVIAMHLAVIGILLIAREVVRKVREQDSFVVTLLPLTRPAEPPPGADQPAATVPPPPAASTPPPIEPPRPRAPSVIPAKPVPPPPAAFPAPKVAVAPDITMGVSGSQGAARIAGYVKARWVRKITDEEFFPLLDEDLWLVPMDVTFRLRCLVAADTTIDCRILSESPTIPGVRKAVLRGLPVLRMRPPMRDGRPQVDEPVEFEWRVGQHNRFSSLDR